MDGWNGSGGKTAARSPDCRRRPWPVFVVAATLILAAFAAWLFFFSGRNRESRRHSGDKRGKIADVAPAKSAKNAAKESKKSAREVVAEFNEQAKDFVKKAPTNNVYWVIPPLAPDDPDNALRTAVAQDIASLLSIVPGEDIPPIIPFHFMLEDEEGADEGGNRVSDGGNAEFLESLKKWKVTIKEGDSAECADIKQRFVDAQLELLDGIDKGLTVNDSIRAAYEYRKRAAATRNALIEAIKDIHDKEPDVEATKEIIAAANKKLEEEGILAISEDDVLPDPDDGIQDKEGEVHTP